MHNITTDRKGILFVLSGPSGVGKSTLYKNVLDNDENLYFSISCTTRKPRPGEENGREYFFISEKEFLDWIAEGKFLEWAKVHDNYYGTLRDEVFSRLENGKDVLLDIDVEGAKNILNEYKDAVSIFIAPPCFDDLEDRIRSRSTESEDEIQKRLCTAKKELENVDLYKYLIYNKKIELAVADLNSIINAERCKNRKKEK